MVVMVVVMVMVMVMEMKMATGQIAGRCASKGDGGRRGMKWRQRRLGGIIGTKKDAGGNVKYFVCIRTPFLPRGPSQA